MSEARPDSGVAPQPVLARNCTVDAVVAAVLFLVGAVVVVQARALGAGWTSDGPGSGYFPFYIGLILCIASAGILFQAVFSKKRDTGAFVDREQLVRVLSVFVPAIFYVLAIVFIGIYVASAIYIAVFMIVLGKYPAWKAALIGVLVSAAFFAMFEVWFKVPLYKGSLDLLAFLGY
ncbi:MAG TPA: tripartite tricarboxylate transporter TctB family protein [Caldimonas sp.]|nr:tripartite tricarboxylate transporter TctB family protein [Caldimonas sp.]